MNKSLPKQYKVESAENSLDKTDIQSGKDEKVDQILSSSAKTKQFMKLCRSHAAEKIQNETLQAGNVFDVKGM